MAVILQVTDLHVEPKGKLAYGAADTCTLLDQIAPWLERAAAKCDAVVVTGDIACDGNEEAYAHVARIFSRLQAPVRMIPGNHDRRDGFMKILADFIEDQWSPERLDQTLELPDARLFLLDTLQPGCHWGALPEGVLSRLEEEISAAEAAGKAAIVFMHHTPVHCGMGKMDEPFGGREALRGIFERHPAARLATGHMHRALAQRFGGASLVTAPSVSVPIYIDLSAGGGDEFLLETPGFALHHLMPDGWTTFFGQIPVQMSFAGPYSFKGAVNPT